MNLIFVIIGILDILSIHAIFSIGLTINIKCFNRKWKPTIHLILFRVFIPNHFSWKHYNSHEEQKTEGRKIEAAQISP